MRKRTIGIAVAVLAVIGYLIFRGVAPAGSRSGSAAVAPASGAAPGGRPQKAPPWANAVPAGSAADGRMGGLEETPGKKVFGSKWGTGPEELGHERPDEGNAWGPMSLATDRKGRVYVLDSVNGRIVRRKADGSPDTTQTVSLTDVQD